MSDFTLRTAPTFLDGVLLTAGAVRDAVLVYCGATCVHEHATATLLPHDPGGDLAQPGDGIRLVTTFTDRSVAPMGTLPVIEATVRRLVEQRRPGLVILAELSRITIAGEDLEGLAEELASALPVPVVAASHRRVVRDGGDAFRGLLARLAARLEPVPGEGDSTSIIGYLSTRTGGDAEGDVQELARLCEGAGRRCAGTWLSGGTAAELARAAGAPVLAATPAGKAAADALSARTGARVLELPLPVGLSGTADWVRAVAGAGGDAAKAEAFVRAQSADARARLDRVVTQRLAGRRAAIVADDEWLDGLCRMFEEDFGVEVALRLSRRRRGPDGEPSDAPERGFDPSVRLLDERIGAEVAAGGLDFVVGSTWERRALRGEAARVPFLEFGYPSMRDHFLRPTPHLGFQGVVTWAERLAAAVAVT